MQDRPQLIHFSNYLMKFQLIGWLGLFYMKLKSFGAPRRTGQLLFILGFLFIFITDRFICSCFPTVCRFRA